MNTGMIMFISKPKAQIIIAAGSEHFMLELLLTSFWLYRGFKLGKGGWIRLWICRADWREQIKCSDNGCAKMHTLLGIKHFGHNRGSRLKGRDPVEKVIEVLIVES